MTENETAELITKLFKALDAANNHLEYCGYGDTWARACAQEDKLSEKIDDALRAAAGAIPSLVRSV